MLSSSSGSLSLRGRPSGLPLSAAGAGTGSLEAPQSSAAVVAAPEPQRSAEASAAPVPAQSAFVSTGGAVVSASQFALDSTAASTVAACSVLNSVVPLSPPQP